GSAGHGRTRRCGPGQRWNRTRGGSGVPADRRRAHVTRLEGAAMMTTARTTTTTTTTTTLTTAQVPVGTQLPEMSIEATPTFVISSAVATRDFQDVHHDRDAAVNRGSKDIFVNILTDNGLVQRFVSEWAGPEALIRAIKVRLGVPCYAYDTLTFTGDVAER